MLLFLFHDLIGIEKTGSLHVKETSIHFQSADWIIVRASSVKLCSCFFLSLSAIFAGIFFSSLHAGMKERGESAFDLSQGKNGLGRCDLFLGPEYKERCFFEPSGFILRLYCYSPRGAYAH